VSVGLGRTQFGLRFKLTPFDEMYGSESSRTLGMTNLKRGGNWQSGYLIQTRLGN